VTTVAQSASPARAPRFGSGLKLVAGSLIGLVLYFLLLTLTQPGGAATAAQQVANALTLGAIYALVALGYTMVYGIIELINFAHGDVFMVGAFMALTFVGQGFGFMGTLGQVPGALLITGLGLGLGYGLISGLGIARPAPRLLALGTGLAVAWLLELGVGASGTIGEPFRLIALLLPAFAVTMIAMGAVNLIIERFAYRPLRHAPRLAPLITAIGVSLILQNIVQIWTGTGDRRVAQVFPTGRVEFLGASIGYLNIFILVVSLLLMWALTVFVRRTRLGRAMRATAQDQQAAQLMGVDLNQTIALTFLIGGALAGAAGVFQSQYFGFVRFDLGFNAGLKAFTAAVLGGIGNTTGAAIGGFIIAFIEVGAGAAGQQRWSQAIVFVVLILVLVFRPAGILGQQIGERA
jgi:branched-chain amino acid transport system permease protein